MSIVIALQSTPGTLPPHFKTSSRAAAMEYGPYFRALPASLQRIGDALNLDIQPNKLDQGFRKRHNNTLSTWEDNPIAPKTTQENRAYQRQYTT